MKWALLLLVLAVSAPVVPACGEASSPDAATVLQYADAAVVAIGAILDAIREATGKCVCAEADSSEGSLKLVPCDGWTAAGVTGDGRRWGMIRIPVCASMR